MLSIHQTPMDWQVSVHYLNPLNPRICRAPHTTTTKRSHANSGALFSSGQCRSRGLIEKPFITLHRWNHKRGDFHSSLQKGQGQHLDGAGAVGPVPQPQHQGLHHPRHVSPSSCTHTATARPTGFMGNKSSKRRKSQALAGVSAHSVSLRESQSF